MTSHLAPGGNLAASASPFSYGRRQIVSVRASITKRMSKPAPPLPLFSPFPGKETTRTQLEQDQNKKSRLSSHRWGKEISEGWNYILSPPQLWRKKFITRSIVVCMWHPSHTCSISTQGEGGTEGGRKNHLDKNGGSSWITSCFLPKAFSCLVIASENQIRAFYGRDTKSGDLLS